MVNVYVLSLGCDKNKVDGEVLLGRLLAAGCTSADDPAEAQVIIINTCGFIREAVQESIDLILEMAAFKQVGVCEKLIVVGCMTERYRGDMDEMPEIDAILGVDDRSRIAEVVLGAASPEKDAQHYRLLARQAADRPHIAYVKIAEGCDNHCTYCTIPAIRGGYKSRPLAEILEECTALINDGVRELVLVAQDSALYGTDIYGEQKLPALLHDLDALCANAPNPIWIRLLYAYPEHITDELIHALATLPRVCKYLDMPIQHSEDSVLARMGRGGSRAALTALISRLRAEVPGIALRTTLMVGFPGETPKEFDGLLRFAREIRFERLGVFPYSREAGTPAADMPRQVSEKTKQTRRDRLMEQQQEIHQAHQRQKIGRTVAVMADGQDPNGNNENRYIGRTQNDAPEVDAVVYFHHAAALTPGTVVDVLITDADEYDLYG